MLLRKTGISATISMKPKVLLARYKNYVVLRAGGVLRSKSLVLGAQQRSARGVPEIVLCLFCQHVFNGFSRPFRN